jgi:serine/threonine protein kinase
VIEFKPCSSLENKNFNYNIILTEFAPYGCFFDIVKNGGLIQEKLIRTYFHQLIEGLEYLHSQNIAHLDLKLENLLLGSDFKLKIADFDQSQELNVFPLKGKGTENYRAPEIIEGNITNFISADIYSAGIVLYAFKAGGFPFCERKEEGWIDLVHYDLFLNDKKAFWEAKVGHKKNKSFFSEEFMELINNMLNKDSERRYKINDIKKSRWYNGPIYSNESLKNEMERIWERILFKKASRRD